MREAEDEDIWQHALNTRAILVTKDEDFPVRAQQARTGPIIIWVRVGNSSNQALRRWFMPQLPQLITWIEEGVRVLEIR